MKLLIFGLIFVTVAAGPAQIKPNKEILNELNSEKGQGGGLDEKVLKSLREWDPLKDNEHKVRKKRSENNQDETKNSDVTTTDPTVDYATITDPSDETFTTTDLPEEDSDEDNDSDDDEDDEDFVDDSDENLQLEDMGHVTHYEYDSKGHMVVPCFGMMFPVGGGGGGGGGGDEYDDEYEEEKKKYKKMKKKMKKQARKLRRARMKMRRARMRARAA